MSELKILIDALSSARFITPNISSNLIAKLLTLTTVENAQRLRRHISVTDRYKSSNHSGYYSVDAINNAVDLHRKIRFYYTDFDVNKKRYVTNDGKPYTISPYELTWDGTAKQANYNLSEELGTLSVTPASDDANVIEVME